MNETNHETPRAHPDEPDGPVVFLLLQTVLDTAHEMRDVILIDGSTHD